MLQYFSYTILHFIKDLRKGSHAFAVCSWTGTPNTRRRHIFLCNVWSHVIPMKPSSFLVGLNKVILKIRMKSKRPRIGLILLQKHLGKRLLSCQIARLHFKLLWPKRGSQRVQMSLRDTRVSLADTIPVGVKHCSEEHGKVVGWCAHRCQGNRLSM